MRKAVSAVLVVLFMALGVFSMTKAASAADEVKMVAVIQTINLAKDGKSATVVLKKDDKEVTVTVDDDMTLDKFKDHRIVEGDEIRLKYEPNDGKNHSTYFRKTAGC